MRYLLLIFLVFSVYADELVICKKGEHNRHLILDYLQQDNAAPCKVFYRKVTELPGHQTLIWHSHSNLDTCIRRMKKFAGKLKSWGWDCQANITITQQTENIKSDINAAAHKPQVKKGNLDKLDLSKKPLHWKMIMNLSLKEMKLMRYTAYAKHGYIFQNTEIQNHFDQQDWYEAQTYDPSVFLTEVEQENINLIQDFEEYLENK